MGVPAIPPSAPYNPLGKPYSAAQKILASAERPFSVTAVMASPPIITQAASDGANSTVIAGSTISLGGGRFNSENPLHATLFGGPISAGRIQGPTSGGSRVQGHGACIAVETYSQTIDFCLRANGGRVQFVVIDSLTGISARVAASDIVATWTAANYYKLDFGSRGLRIIMAYVPNVGNSFGINVPLTDSVWPAVLNEPKIAAIWDSYGEGSMNDGTLNLKLAALDYWAAMLGVHNPWVNALGSTGVIADAAGTKTNYLGRLNAGDFDISRVGAFDLILWCGSVNDNTVGQGGTANDATLQAAQTAALLVLMAKQPNAIIVGIGPEFTNSGPPNQARFDAYKAGFVAAAAGDPRMIYIDNAPNAGNYLFGNSAAGINSIVIGADNVHLNGTIGTSYWGERMGRDTTQAIKAAYSL